MIHNFSQKNSILNQYIAELRDVDIQTNRPRFRRNLERIGEIFAYEISKTIPFVTKEVETPLGIAEVQVPAESPVLATIMRAGLPMHNGTLNVFDAADSAFVFAYRKHHKDGSFEIKSEYVTCTNLDDRILIITDPMLATGASMGVAIDRLLENGTPKKIHVVTAIAASDGIDYLRRVHSNVVIWTGAVDEELTAKSYIVPGLGDAGDLAFGDKLQD